MHTIFFDFGNVVGFFDHRRAIRRLVRHCDMSEGAILELAYSTDLEDAFEAGRLTTDEFVRRACEAIGYRGEPDEFCAAFVDIFTPNPDVCALIPRLKQRYRLVLASNTNDLHAKRFRAQFADVLRHFDAVALSHEARARKPHPAFFSYCQSLTTATPTDCVFIDDLKDNVEAARAFGWNAIQYTSFADLQHHLEQVGITT